MDESTDTAQVTIFIRRVDRDFTLVEELANVIPLKGTTRGTDLYLHLTQTLDKCQFNFCNISAITTDGAKSMTGEKIGVTTLLKSDVKASGNNTVITFHCVIHQENLCKKSFSNFEHGMNVVVKVVNFIRSKGLNHRQFQRFLSDLEAKYGDVVYYAEVRWLSPGKMLQHLFSLKSE
ncbi:General transcription factor II-I repeat domain-containing protein 2B, partial [Stegodyphus mimosarum]